MHQRVDSDLSNITSDSEPEDVSTQISPHECQALNLINQGSTAEVFQGLYDGKDVAIKRLTGVGFAKDRQSRREYAKKKAFMREVTILQQVHHKNLVCMFGVTSSPLQIVMELCRGGSCFDLIHVDGTFELSWHQAIKIAFDIGNAMCVLHGADPQIIHRDLKSQNILLVEKVAHRGDVPWAKVADFGLARFIAKGRKSQKYTMDVGTFHWMAPEVFIEDGVYDEKVDVYSFGMILYELICSKIPFEELEPHDLAEASAQSKRPSLDLMPDTCPEKLRMLMTTCWKQEPTRRPSFTNAVKWLCMVANELGFDPDEPGRIAQL